MKCFQIPVAGTLCTPIISSPPQKNTSSYPIIPSLTVTYNIRPYHHLLDLIVNMITDHNLCLPFFFVFSYSLFSLLLPGQRRVMSREGLGVFFSVFCCIQHVFQLSTVLTMLSVSFHVFSGAHCYPSMHLICCRLSQDDRRETCSCNMVAV